MTYFDHGAGGLRLLDKLPPLQVPPCDIDDDPITVDGDGEHDHDPDECIPCDRCNHLRCQHSSDVDDCQACDTCVRFMAAGDCHECNGDGAVSLDGIWHGSEQTMPCYECDATGSVRR